MRNKKCLWFSSLWARLLFMLALIMLITQAISVLWLWHESQEQIVELVKLAQDPAYSDEELLGLIQHYALQRSGPAPERSPLNGLAAEESGVAVE